MRKLDYVKLSMPPVNLSRRIFLANECYERLNRVICIKMQVELGKQHHHVSKLYAQKDT